MNEQEALRREMLDRRIELIFEEMERNHPEFSQEEAELSHIRDEIEQDPLLGPAGKKKMQEYICFLSRMEQRHNRNIYNSNLSHRARSVYMYLKDRADSEGRCWPAIRTIALELGLSRSTVKRALDDLCRAGLLQKDPRWRENGSLTSNLYHVV